MYKINATLLLLSTCLATSLLHAEAAPRGLDIQPKIINGRDATETQFPWQVGLIADSRNIYLSQYCSGAILDARWILTAAHCVSGRDQQSVTVVAGINDLLDNTNAQILAVDEIIIHPQFGKIANSNAINHDIALLRLRTPIDFIRCGQRCGKIDWLNAQSEAASIQRGTPALINGWGRTVDCQAEPQRCNTLESSIFGLLQLKKPQLQWAAVNIDGCLNGSSRHDPEQITANMLCAAAPRFTEDTCQGDSGGGMTVTAADGRGQVLAGITSWGRGCAQTDFPAVYTRVARYDQWISNRMLGLPSSVDRQVSNVDNSTFWQNLNPPRTTNNNSGGGSFGFWGLGLLAGLGLLRQLRRQRIQ